ncbi:hypothetical protein J6590_049666 [Homalodisca vitripennis]|nr:hypothetical protein J6590_049666 [Homalodisca vitripennis]
MAAFKLWQLSGCWSFRVLGVIHIWKLQCSCSSSWYMTSPGLRYIPAFGNTPASGNPQFLAATSLWEISAYRNPGLWHVRAFGSCRPPTGFVLRQPSSLAAPCNTFFRYPLLVAHGLWKLPTSITLWLKQTCPQSQLVFETLSISSESDDQQTGGKAKTGRRDEKVCVLIWWWPAAIADAEPWHDVTIDKRAPYRVSRDTAAATATDIASVSLTRQTPRRDVHPVREGRRFQIARAVLKRVYNSVLAPAFRLNVNLKEMGQWAG